MTTRNILIIGAAIIIAPAVGIIASFPEKSKSESKIAHLSIDDVEIAFADIISHQNEYKSIFDNSFLSSLQKYHEEYGAKITLYTYAKTASYNLSDFPDKFKKDFSDNSDWLKIGFHWTEPAFTEGIDLNCFKESLTQVDSAVMRFAGENSTTRTLRLHYFYLPDSLLIAFRGGVNLLSADTKGRKSYNLSDKETELLWDNRFLQKDSIKYFSTDIRIEAHPIIAYELKKHQNRDTLVIFTHEWQLGPQNIKEVAAALIYDREIRSKKLNEYNLEYTCKWLHDNGYTFSFLE